MEKLLIAPCRLQQPRAGDAAHELRYPSLASRGRLQEPDLVPPCREAAAAGSPPVRLQNPPVRAPSPEPGQIRSPPDRQRGQRHPARGRHLPGRRSRRLGVPALQWSHRAGRRRHRSPAPRGINVPLHHHQPRRVKGGDCRTRPGGATHRPAPPRVGSCPVDTRALRPAPLRHLTPSARPSSHRPWPNRVGILTPPHVSFSSTWLPAGTLAARLDCSPSISTGPLGSPRSPRRRIP